VGAVIFNVQTPALISISGVQYLTTGTVFGIPAARLTINRLYFIDQSVEPRPRALISGELPAATSNTRTLDLRSTSPNYVYYEGASGLAPAGTSPPNGVPYYNTNWTYTSTDASSNATFLTTPRTALTFSINITNGGGMSAGINGTTNLGYNYYGNANIDEGTIPNNQVPSDGVAGATTTNGAITTMLRIGNNSSTSADKPVFADLLVAGRTQIQTLGTNECTFNPYTRVLTTNSAVKYLTIRLTMNSSLDSFRIRLGGSATGINKVFVRWTVDGSNTTLWQDASIRASASADGCWSGSNNGTTFFNITRSRISPNPTGSFVPSFIYINVRFNGTLNFNQINVT
jgi:hypothetical protein